MSFAATTFSALERLRAKQPLVVNVTNSVVTNFTANVLLSLGASPAMTHAPRDAGELAGLAQAVVCNMGTPGEAELASMVAACQAAGAAGVPVVFDPVAVGATSWRREVARQVLDSGPVAVIRGNASEILFLAGENVRSRGVDSLHGSDEAGEAAARLARDRQCVVCVSGAVDVISDGRRTVRLAGGDVMMTRVTGMGCAATAVVGAFAGLGDAALEATVAAMAVMSTAGAVAAHGATGPGSLAARFLDALFGLTEAALQQEMQVMA